MAIATTSRGPQLVEPQERWVLMTDGRGDPNGSGSFQAAVGTLFSVSYGLRFALKRELDVDRKVGPLEGLWWTDRGGFSFERRTNWRWTLLVEQPPEATAERVEAVARDRANEVPLRLEAFREGRAAQVLHVGPFSEEPRTIERLHAFIQEQGLRPTGRHHEIYLSDMRRTAPERWRTIIRQPVAG